MTEVYLNDIISYTVKNRRYGDYSMGAFYLITDENKKPLYVGKAICLMERLKSHYYYLKRDKGLAVDRYMYLHQDRIRFFIIDTYKNIGIDFFNRKLESIIEHTYIGEYKTYFPHGLNMVYYDKLQLK